jgi:hypothetical protein
MMIEQRIIVIDKDEEELIKLQHKTKLFTLFNFGQTLDK